MGMFSLSVEVWGREWITLVKKEKVFSSKRWAKWNSNFWSMICHSKVAWDVFHHKSPSAIERGENGWISCSLVILRGTHFHQMNLEVEEIGGWGLEEGLKKGGHGSMGFFKIKDWRSKRCLGDFQFVTIHVKPSTDAESSTWSTKHHWRIDPHTKTSVDKQKIHNTN